MRTARAGRIRKLIDRDADDLEANKALADLYERQYREEKNRAGPAGAASDHADRAGRGERARQPSRSDGGADVRCGRNAKTQWRLTFQGIRRLSRSDARPRPTGNWIAAYDGYRRAYSGDLDHFWSGLAALADVRDRQESCVRRGVHAGKTRSKPNATRETRRRGWLGARFRRIEGWAFGQACGFRARRRASPRAATTTSGRTSAAAPTGCFSTSRGTLAWSAPTRICFTTTSPWFIGSATETIEALREPWGSGRSLPMRSWRNSARPEDQPGPPKDPTAGRLRRPLSSSSRDIASTSPAGRLRGFPKAPPRRSRSNCARSSPPSSPSIKKPAGSVSSLPQPRRRHHLSRALLRTGSQEHNLPAHAGRRLFVGDLQRSRHLALALPHAHRGRGRSPATQRPVRVAEMAARNGRGPVGARQ